MKAVIRTEVWGNTVKAVVRDDKGRFLGATNQTEAVKVAKVVRPRVTLVGAK
jgi:hypothetical protein